MARPCITQPQKCPSCLWATKASRELFAFKMCSQRHIKQRAQPSGAPPTARPSKCTISSVTRAWSGMTTLKPRQRSTHVLEHAQTHHGIPLHTKDARNSTSDSARNSCLSDQSPAHENASRQAVYGPGVAAQVNSFLTRALGNPKRMPGSLCTHKMPATRHRRQRA